MNYKQKKIKEFKEKFPLHHYSCEDSWYSCPKSEEGCSDDRAGDECNCGAEEKQEEMVRFISDTIDELQSKQLEPISEKELYPIIHSLRTEQDYIPSKDIVEMICSKLGQPKCECEVDYEQMIGLMSETHSGNINEAMEIIKSFKDNESKWLTIKER